MICFTWIEVGAFFINPPNIARDGRTAYDHQHDYDDLDDNCNHDDLIGKGDNVDEIIVKVPRETGLMTFSKQKLKLNKNWPYYMYFAFDVVTFCAAI